jgi:hypothetical protein
MVQMRWTTKHWESDTRRKTKVIPIANAGTPHYFMFVSFVCFSLSVCVYVWTNYHDVCASNIQAVSLWFEVDHHLLRMRCHAWTYAIYMSKQAHLIFLNMCRAQRMFACMHKPIFTNYIHHARCLHHIRANNLRPWNFQSQAYILQKESLHLCTSPMSLTNMSRAHGLCHWIRACTLTSKKIYIGKFSKLRALKEVEHRLKHSRRLVRPRIHMHISIHVRNHVYTYYSWKLPWFDVFMSPIPESCRRFYISAEGAAF